MVSFVYFDVGGVVVLDFSGTDKWDQLKKEIGISKSKDAKFESFWDRYEPKVNAGQDVETLLPLIKIKFGSKLPEDYSLLIDGFVKRFEANRSIWPVIEKIHKKCKIGLLTNMYPHMLEAIKNRKLLPKIKWDIIIDSSVEGITKPDSKIFKIAEKRSGFKENNILFVDNSQKNIEAAMVHGWQVFLYDSAHPKEESRRLLESFKWSL
jgi:FMN phosphatase YigB (HAD superfamily)